MTVVSADLLLRKGCLPESWPAMGTAWAPGAVPLTPDVQPAICRRLAALPGPRYPNGHTGGAAYALTEAAYVDAWDLLALTAHGHVESVREFGLCDVSDSIVPSLRGITDPDAALLAILHSLPDEVAP